MERPQQKVLGLSRRSEPIEDPFIAGSTTPIRVWGGRGCEHTLESNK